MKAFDKICLLIATAPCNNALLMSEIGVTVDLGKRAN